MLLETPCAERGSSPAIDQAVTHRPPTPKHRPLAMPPRAGHWPATDIRRRRPFVIAYNGSIATAIKQTTALDCPWGVGGPGWAPTDVSPSPWAVHFPVVLVRIDTHHMKYIRDGHHAQCGKPLKDQFLDTVRQDMAPEPSDRRGSSFNAGCLVNQTRGPSLI